MRARRALLWANAFVAIAVVAATHNSRATRSARLSELTMPEEKMSKNALKKAILHAEKAGADEELVAAARARKSGMLSESTSQANKDHVDIYGDMDVFEREFAKLSADDQEIVLSLKRYLLT